MRGDNRTKILSRWRTQYAAALEAHKAATAAADKEAAGRHVRTMKGLERAIRAYGGEMIGPAAHVRPESPLKIFAGGHEVTASMPRTAARLAAMRAEKKT